MELDVDLGDLMATKRAAAPTQQQQQQQQMPGAPVSRLRVEVRYMAPDDQQPLLPRRARAPALIPPEAPLPQPGHVIYLSSTSAWGVEMVVHEWLSPTDLNIEVWITHVGSARHRRPPGFTLTQ